MKIDYSKHKLNKDSKTHSKESEIEALSNFEKLSIKPEFPIWKNEVVNESQMEAKPSEESPVAEESHGEEVKESPEDEEPKQQETQSEQQDAVDDEEKSDEVRSKVKTKVKQVRVASTSSQTHAEESESAEFDTTEKQEDQKSGLVDPPPPPPMPQLEYKRRIIVKHSILGNKIPSHDPNVLVESSTFTSIGKIQPFLINISTNASIVIDYHSHLTTSEVVGYLAGSWDINTHTLTVTQAFPCRCRLGDYESAPKVESDIRKAIKSNGLTVVGWYHSHPTSPATPSIRDIELQLDYELRMKGANDSSYLPCIGIISSPYNLDSTSFESTMVCYWVSPPPENKIHEYGKPMMMSYSVFQDQSISYEVLLEMKKCADFYKPEKDYIQFLEIFKGPVAFVDKLKMSVMPKFPLNHKRSESLWNIIKDITITNSVKPETEILEEMKKVASVPKALPPAPAPVSPAPSDKSKFNIPSIPPPLTPLSFKPTPNTSPTHAATTPSNLQFQKSHSRSKTTGKRSSSRENKHLASLSNYFVGSDLAALFGSGKFPGMGLDPATKSLLNLNTLSLGGMFLPPMAAAAAAAAATYKPDPAVGLMKPPPPPPTSYYSFPTSRTSSSNSRASTCTTSPSSRPLNRSIPSTSRDMPPPNKVPKLDVHQMASFFIPPNLGKNCTITNRPSTSTSSK